ncbi:hypothetical protein D187_006930 [Cystobacter fuscus DSM 2262]|uniref:Uncharacterized protein n=1 Tax=Cystobacter fuscus (strain ATCC 25194 / DSM 2262 / NBRC 100088 / M29) TaxID=1242864 RepID=S9P235_CYSF2|nr:hypothetical protein D187_006930 [Cystobacter fuscus DSM 2262]
MGPSTPEAAQTGYVFTRRRGWPRSPPHTSNRRSCLKARTNSSSGGQATPASRKALTTTAVLSRRARSTRSAAPAGKAPSTNNPHSHSRFIMAAWTPGAAHPFHQGDFLLAGWLAQLLTGLPYAVGVTNEGSGDQDP